MCSHQNLTRQEEEINSLVKSCFGIDGTYLIGHWSRIFKLNTKHKGRKFAISYAKQLYSQAVQYSLYQEIDRIPFRKCDKDGIVKDLKPFKHFLRTSDKSTRYALTILRSYERYKIAPSRDLSTVTESCTKTLSKQLLSEFRDFVNRSFIRKVPRIELTQPKDHLSTKKGPGAKPALLEWKSDLVNLDSQARTVLDAIIELSTILGDNYMAKRIDFLLKDLQLEEISEHPLTRIQVFPASGGKTRIIAIYDYWSQRALRSLHKAIFQNLKLIKSDCTFGHESASEWIKTQDPTVPLFSYDLTAATDRIPMELHSIVLERSLLSSQRKCAPLIEKILLREFTLSWSMQTKVSYNCGQPMGAYGSWALLAYTHHAIAMYCGCSKNDYRIIGDDIVIRGANNARRYLSFMTEIGVSISESKSIISGGNLPFVVGEVAKRLIRGKVEITPPTPNLISKAYNDWTMFPMLLDDMARRSYLTSEIPLKDLINSWYSAKWKSNLLTVLSFPYTRCSPAGENLLSKVRAEHYNEYWYNLDEKALRIKFLKFRSAKLNKTALALLKDFDIFEISQGEDPNPDGDLLYADSPEMSVRVNMVRRIVITSLALERAIEEIAKSPDDPPDLLYEIMEEELYTPDLSFQFLERKERRQKFLSTTVLELHRRIGHDQFESFIANNKLSALQAQLSTSGGTVEDEFRIREINFLINQILMSGTNVAL